MHLEREVLPHVPDAWVDESKTKTGYEINFNRYFYRYAPSRPLAAIEADVKNIEKEIADMLAEIPRGHDSNVAMKDSGFMWLGDVPEHWKVLACKFGYSTRLGKMLQNDPESPEDIQVPYLKAAHVQWGSVSVSDLPVMWVSSDESKKFSVKNGDLLVCEGGETGTSGYIGPRNRRMHYSKCAAQGSGKRRQ